VSASQRILVTGGTGVIGAWAVRELVEAGHEVSVLTRGATTAGQGIIGARVEAVDWIRADLGQPLQLFAAVHKARPDVIAHLASAKPWQMDAGYVEHPDPPLGVRTIIDGTSNLLEVARTLGVPRVVFASSKSAYAPFAGVHGAPAYVPVPETYPSVPVEVYGITKLAAEQLGLYYRRHLGVDFIALRFASTYGPFKRGAGAAPAGLIAAAIEGRSLQAVYRRAAFEDLLDEFVYNRDVGRAIRRACEVDRTEGAVFNIGPGVGSSVRDVVAAIGSVDGVTAPDITIGADHDESAIAGHLVAGHAGILDSAAARVQLGFECEYDLRRGIEDARQVVQTGAGLQTA
jgi:UDP-glucose 4-epimerase